MSSVPPAQPPIMYVCMHALLLLTSLSSREAAQQDKSASSLKQGEDLQRLSCHHQMNPSCVLPPNNEPMEQIGGIP